MELEKVISPGLKELLDAAHDENDPDALKKLLSQRQDDLDQALESVLLDDTTPSELRMKYVEILLALNANPNKVSCGTEPLLIWSVCKENPELVNLLLKYRANINIKGEYGECALHYCAERGLVDMAMLLINAGADINIQDNSGFIPLLPAILKESWDMVEVLWDESDFSLESRQGYNTLHSIIFDGYGKPLATQALAKAIKERMIHIDTPDCDRGDTPLEIAARWGFTDFFKLILKSGCDLEFENYYDETALNIVAAMDISDPTKPELPAKAEEFTRALISAGADMDHVSLMKRTPLMDGVYASNTLVVRRLLMSNCTVKVKKLRTEDHLTNFMLAAICNDAKDCATYIFGDCCSSVEKQDLGEYFYDLSHTPEATVKGETIGLCKPPVSLYRLCRMAMRDMLPKGDAFLSALDQLPMPAHVKSFVGLKP